MEELMRKYLYPKENLLVKMILKKKKLSLNQMFPNESLEEILTMDTIVECHYCDQKPLKQFTTCISSHFCKNWYQAAMSSKSLLIFPRISLEIKWIIPIPLLITKVRLNRINIWKKYQIMKTQNHIDPNSLRFKLNSKQRLFWISSMSWHSISYHILYCVIYPFCLMFLMMMIIIVLTYKNWN